MECCVDTVATLYMNMHITCVDMCGLARIGMYNYVLHHFHKEPAGYAQNLMVILLLLYLKYYRI